MADPLPSWNAGAAKTAIFDFIDRVGQVFPLSSAP
jgi:hypothetical protein